MYSDMCRKWRNISFLSSNAQDFIEDMTCAQAAEHSNLFLSSNAQDFIEERWWIRRVSPCLRFLSSNAQDFIEEMRSNVSILLGSDS